MLSKFKTRLFTSLPSLEQHNAEQGISGRAIEFLSVPRYPPFDKGLPNVPVEAILDSQEEVIAKIRENYGVLDPIFNELVLGIIYNYANYIHLLPATGNGHFRGAGGLFRLGLEIAFNSYQLAQEYVFAGNFSPAKRRELEPRWQHAAFIAGICSEIYHPLTEMMVVDEKGDQWESYLSPLSEWLIEGNRDRYYIRWASKSSESREMTGAYVVRSIVPKHVIQYLNDCSLEIFPQVLGAIVNSNKLGHDNPLQQIVRTVKLRVIERDVKADYSSYGKLSVGVHLESYFIDAMRLLFNTRVWGCNQKKARVWFNHEGVFIVWPKGGEEIIDVLRGDKLPGIPNTVESVSDLLIKSNIIVPHPQSGRSIWDIYVPSVKSTFMAVKLSNPEILFENEHPSLLNESFMPIPKKELSAHKMGDGNKNGINRGFQSNNSRLPNNAHPVKEIDGEEKAGSDVQVNNLESHEEVIRALPESSVVNSSGNSVNDESIQLSPSASSKPVKPSLDQSVIESLSKIAQYLKDPSHRHPSMFIDVGIAIPFDVFTEVKVDITETSGEMANSGLLILTEQDGKKYHKMKINNKLQNVIVLNKNSAILFDICQPTWWNK